MGVELVDKHSIGHFVAGMISYVLLKELKWVSTFGNFVISNGVHGWIEYMEHDFAPNGKQLESSKNHQGDIIAFFIGWFLAYYYDIRIQNKYIINVCWLVLIRQMVEEIYREVYPNNSCNGAFK
tara:strand:+ start:254 stop:625 length:372 start_codon:yes stop_codon:yes gene_type:complete